MEAKLRHQSPLKWEDFEKKNAGIPDPPPLPDVSYLLSRCTTRCTQYITNECGIISLQMQLMIPL